MRKLKTASQASNKLMPLHKQIATGLTPKRKSLSK
jgi:hypothetical protein